MGGIGVRGLDIKYFLYIIVYLLRSLYTPNIICLFLFALVYVFFSLGGVMVGVEYWK